MKIKNIALLIGLVCIQSLSCKSTRGNSTSKVKGFTTDPVNFSDENCATYGTLATLEKASCPGEKLAMQKYFNMANLNSSQILLQYRSKLNNLFASLGSLKQRQVRSYEAGLSESDALLQQYNTNLANVIKVNQAYVKTLDLLDQIVDLQPGVSPSDVHNNRVSVMAQIQALKCVGIDGFDFDQDFAGALCELQSLSDKLNDMIQVRQQAVYQYDDSGVPTASANDIAARDFQWSVLRTSLIKAKSDVDSLKAEITALVRTNAISLETGQIEALSSKPISYFGLVMAPSDIRDSFNAAFNSFSKDLENLGSNALSMFEMNITEEQRKANINQLQISEADNTGETAMAKKEIDRLNAMIKAKEQEKVSTLNETIASRSRIATDLKSLISVSDSPTVEVPLGGNLNAGSPSELAGLTVDLSSLPKGKTNALYIRATSVPNIVANGVYLGANHTFTAIKARMEAQEHWKYKTNEFGQSKKKCVKGGSPDYFNRDYGSCAVEEDSKRYLYSKGLYSSFANPEGSTYGQLTNGLDGYIVSRNVGSGSSVSQNPNGAGRAAPLAAIGGFIGAAVGTYYGGQTAKGFQLGSSIGGTIGSALDSASFKAYGTSTSTSTGVAYRSGYYHVLAKYPDIVLGQLVGELGCNGVYNKKPDIFYYDFGMVKLDSLPAITPPVSGGKVQDFRFPAGENATILVNVPPACENPTLRFIINDLMQAIDNPNCLDEPIGDKALIGFLAPGFKVPDAVTNGLYKDRASKVCSYFTRTLTLNVAHIRSTSEEVQAGVELIKKAGLTDSTQPNSTFANLAYSADAYQQMTDKVTQLANESGLSRSAVEFIKPIVRNFVTGLLNERKLVDISTDLNSLKIQRDGIIERLDSLKNKSELYTKVVASGNAILDLTSVHAGFVSSRQQLIYSRLASSAQYVKLWGNMLIDSLEYNQYNGDGSGKEVVKGAKSSFQNALRGIDRVLMATPDVNGGSANALKDVVNQLNNFASTIQTTMTFQDNLIQLRQGMYISVGGHCSISLAHVYQDKFVLSSLKAAYSNEAGGPGKKADFLIPRQMPSSGNPLDNRNSIGLSSKYSELADKSYYYIPVDTTTLLENLSLSNDFIAESATSYAARARPGFICTDDANVLKTSTPRMLGVGVEFYGLFTDLDPLVGAKLLLDRSDVMNWYTASGNRFFRTLDYSFFSTDSLGALLKPKASLTPITGTISNTNLSTSVCGTRFENPMKTECLLNVMGATGADATGSGGGLNFKGWTFRPAEFNTLLGNKWGIVISDRTAQEYFLKASNVVVHFYYYRSQPLVSVKSP